MRYSPSIVPEGRPGTYFVLNDFGDELGRAWPEADERRTDRETVIHDLLAGQYSEPIRVVAFNINEGWCRNVSAEVASEVADRIASDGRDIPVWLRRFIKRHAWTKRIAGGWLAEGAGAILYVKFTQAGAELFP